MANQTTNLSETRKNRILEIARKIFLFGALGIALFTIYKMVGKKFGWFG